MTWVAQSGSFGTDHSANPPSLGGLNLLATVNANAKRNAVGVQNQSTATLTLVRDDGAGNNTTVLILAPAAAAGAQGSDWTSLSFKGRLRIFGTAGSQIAAWED